MGKKHTHTCKDVIWPKLLQESYPKCLCVCVYLPLLWIQRDGIYFRHLVGFFSATTYATPPCSILFVGPSSPRRLSSLTSSEKTFSIHWHGGREGSGSVDRWSLPSLIFKIAHWMMGNVDLSVYLTDNQHAPIYSGGDVVAFLVIFPSPSSRGNTTFSLWTRLCCG